MSDFMNTILYEDDEVRVIWSPGADDIVLVTFGDLVNLAKGLEFFAEKPLKKLGIAAVGVMAKRGNWFPSESIQKASSAILDKISGHRARITYGGSMGGYGAIKFSRLLSATHVIALCPQWSLDPQECEGSDPGWRNFFVDHMNGMGIRRSDVSGDVFIFSDPFDALDMFHLRMIMANASCHHIRTPMIGHHVTSVFAGTSNIKTIIDSCLTQDLTNLRIISRNLRKAHGIYRSNLANHAERMFPTLTISRMASARHEIPPNETRRFLPQILKYIVDRFGKQEAVDYFRKIIPHINTNSDQQLICQYLASLINGKSTISTWRRSSLFFDISKRIVTPKETQSAWDTPVEIELVGNSAKLFIHIGNSKFYIAIAAHSQLGVCRISAGCPDSEILFDIKPQNGRFTISNNGKYLCAEHDKKIVCNRSSAGAWEEFQFDVHI